MSDSRLVGIVSAKEEALEGVRSGAEQSINFISQLQENSELVNGIDNP